MERLSEMQVGEIMQTEVVTVRPGDTVRKVVGLLSERGVGGVPVVDADGVAVGVVSATDVIRLAAEAKEASSEGAAAPAPAVGEGEGGGDAAEGARHGFFRLPDGPLLHYPLSLPAMTTAAKLETTAVREIMMPATFSVRRDTTVRELAAFLVKGGIHRALVLERGRLVGIVTAFDVLRAVAGQRRREGMATAD